MEEGASREYITLIAKDGSRKSTSLLQSLEDAEREDVSLVYGPTYLTTTQSGDEVTIKTLLIDYQHSNKDLNYRTICLIAEDRYSRVLGSRRTFLCEQTNEIQASGQIVTFERGRGVGTLIELAHMDMLGREANERGIPVRYEVIDDNSIGLAELIRQEAKKPFFRRSNKELIAAKEEEHKRWLALYGPEGKLGFDAKHQRMFTPQQQGISLVDIDTIVLQRNQGVQDGRILLSGVVSSITPVENREKVQIRKWGEFLNKTKPNLVAVARGVN